MKIGLVYTGTTTELIKKVEAEVKAAICQDMTLMTYQNGDILAHIRAAGYVTSEAAALLVDLYMKAIHDGVDVILNACSSVGEVADAMQDFAKYCGVPIVRIDEEMCREAVCLGKRIGILATLPTTMEPTKNILYRIAREMNQEVALVEGLIEGAFGLDPDAFGKQLLDKAGAIVNQVDVLLLCQGSMAYCEEKVQKAYGKPTLSSPRFGALALKDVLKRKGVLGC